ncbi:hypothetical protein [Chondromyces crocatus]|uniref:Outer membrane protein beta-barrel domain-containing protein n=1 Tax=Chondromyces crocatus TaxID=52 RepID=A0A0K1EN07_CHOCO|nr:hypothetical protein [Chondromyces crocatus]AKT42285.1 uncharacterized protein CMC5_065080 [Chondromyces crocatus]
MRATSCLALATAIAGAALSSPAAADTMDPALARLVTNGGCRTLGPGGGLYYNPASSFARCQPDNASFAKLVAQYGFAVAPTAMHSARTTGYGGFELGIEAAYTKIDSSAEYWKQGTRGPQDPTTKQFSIYNQEPDSMLQHYALKVRKGFPFGLELASAVGFLGNTSIVTAGADVRMSVFEGFRTGIPAIFPELAVGGSVRTITGTEEFQLTVAGVDAQISKPLPIAGTVVLTPYVGYQWTRIFGDSGLIDTTPNTDALDYCDFRGTNTPATPGNTTGVYDGQPVCGAGSSADFNNTVVFDAVRLTRHRLNFGAQLRFQMVKFGVHFITDLTSAEDANQGQDYEIDGVNKFAGVGRQWTLALDLGAVF